MQKLKRLLENYKYPERDIKYTQFEMKLIDKSIFSKTTWKMCDKIL